MKLPKIRVEITGNVGERDPRVIGRRSVDPLSKILGA